MIHIKGLQKYYYDVKYDNSVGPTTKQQSMPHLMYNLRYRLNSLCSTRVLPTIELKYAEDNAALMNFQIH
jgi:hypothetical protein